MFEIGNRYPRNILAKNGEKHVGWRGKKRTSFVYIESFGASKLKRNNGKKIK